MKKCSSPQNTENTGTFQQPDALPIGPERAPKALTSKMSRPSSVCKQQGVALKAYAIVVYRLDEICDNQ